MRPRGSAFAAAEDIYVLVWPSVLPSLPPPNHKHTRSTLAFATQHQQQRILLSLFDSINSISTRDNGLLSSLPRSPTPATTVASCPRSKQPNTISATSSTLVDDTKHHNACCHLPSVPRPTANPSSSTSTDKVRAAPRRSHTSAMKVMVLNQQHQRSRPSIPKVHHFRRQHSQHRRTQYANLGYPHTRSRHKQPGRLSATDTSTSACSRACPLSIGLRVSFRPVHPTRSTVTWSTRLHANVSLTILLRRQDTLQLHSKSESVAASSSESSTGPHR